MGDRVLLTEDQLRHREIVEDVASLGQDFEAIVRELSATGQAFTSDDILWVALNRAAVEAMRQSAWVTLSGIYHWQASILFDRGKPWQRVAKEAARASLRAYLEAGIRLVEVDACGCEACSGDDRKRFEYTAELREPHLPHESCENGVCYCGYAPITTDF